MAKERECAKCGEDGRGRGGLIGIGGCLLCGICVEMYRQSPHAPEHGGRGVTAWIASEPRRQATTVQLSAAAYEVADRLAQARGLSRSRLIEQLILEAEEKK